MSRGIRIFFAALVLSGTTALAQDTAKDKKIESILGTWKIQKVLSGKTEVAKNPTSGQWIEFRSDGKYVNNMTAVDSGSFRINENHSILYLESATAAKPVVAEWEISLNGDALTMQQKANGNDKKTRDKMKYVYVRIEKGSNKLNN